MGFEEWFEKHGELYREPTSDERYIYEAGAASRQTELNELQKRIDEALDMLEGRKGKVLLDDIVETLKGELK